MPLTLMFHIRAIQNKKALHETPDMHSLQLCLQSQRLWGLLGIANGGLSMSGARFAGLWISLGFG